MKVNLKKIGAIVAGATILASTAAFGTLWYKDTKLVDENGAAVAKVVVGEHASASDGVAAALIAGRMVGGAYKSVALKGQVVGSASCGGATGNATGSCAISEEKTQLEITVPGGISEGTYTVNNLIGDLLNRRLLDRKDNIADDSDSDYPLGNSDVSDNANPFTNGQGSSIGPSKHFIYRISGSMFGPFQTTSVKDDTAGRTYSEQQDAWFDGQSNYEENRNGVVGRLNSFAYTLKFKGASDDLGIPTCTTPVNSTNYNSCTEDYKTSSHKVRVQFLGEPWVISEMIPPADQAGTQESYLYNGGSIKLAKESISGVLNQGESLPVEGLKFHLDDLQALSGVGGVQAIFSVLDANDNVLKKDKVAEGTTKEFQVNGKTYRIHVYKVAPGYTFGAKWADVAVYSKEILLQDGQQLDPDYDTNKEYTVSLGWKDKGADGTVDHLRSVVLFTDTISAISSGGEDYMAKGDYIPIVQDPVAWKFTYNGLDLTSADRSSLKFSLERTSNKTISKTNGPLNSSGIGTECQIYAPYVTVTSGKAGSTFETVGTGYATGSSLSDKTFIIATADDGSGYGASCSADIGDINSGSLFMKVSPGNARYDFVSYTGTAGMDVKYSSIGDGDTNWDTGGILEYVDFANSATSPMGVTYLNGGSGVDISAAASGDWFFAFSEKAGVDTSNNFADYALFGLKLNGPTSTFNYDSDDGATPPATQDITAKEYILYSSAGPVSPQGTVSMIKEGSGTTERGTIFTSIEDTSVDFQMANKLAHSQFTLSSVDTNASAAGSTCLKTLGVGESYVCAGVTVKVLDITETVGSCSAGGASASCGAADMTGVTAKVVDDAGAEVAKAYMPNANAYKGLVILDRDAAGYNTLVSVGGDKVNTVTASLLESSPVDWTTEKKLVKQVVQGSKIVVAGAESEDTLAAAGDFIAAVTETN